MLDWSDPGTVHMTVTNWIMLLATIACVLAVAVPAIIELGRRRTFLVRSSKRTSKR